MSKNYGLPYMGSKSKIAPYLCDYMINRHPNRHIFIDCCCGGGAMLDYITQKYPFISVLANDLDKNIIDCLKAFKNGSMSDYLLDYGYRWLDRDTYKQYLEEYKDNGIIQTILISAWTFGNKNNDKSTYLYGKDIELQKELLTNLLLYGNDDNLSNYYYKHINDNDFVKEQCDTIIAIYEEMPKSIKEMNYFKNKDKRIKFFQFFKQQIKSRKLTELQQLEQLERLELYNMDCIEFVKSLPKEILNKAIIYFDPPYINTASYTNGFGSINEKIRQFALENKDIPIYISEYTPYEGLQVVNYINKQSLLATSETRKYKKELLMYNGCQDKEETLLDLLNI